MAKTLKLSELADDIEIGREEHSEKYTVAELKREIKELGVEHHLYDDWYRIQKRRWSPNAKDMIDYYIEVEYSMMYEGWGEKAQDCICDAVIGKLQAALDEAFKDDYATVYWTFEEKVEIDIFPHEAGDLI